MKLPQGFKSMPVKDKKPNELYIKISKEEGAFVDLLNKEMEELLKKLRNNRKK